MAESQFRYRGLKVVVDTTQPAEFDIADLDLPTATSERAASILRRVPFSTLNQSVNGMQIRQMLGLDFVYTVSRDTDALVITILAVRRPDPKNPTDELLRKISLIDMLRGATGL